MLKKSQIGPPFCGSHLPKEGPSKTVKIDFLDVWTDKNLFFKRRLKAKEFKINE